MKTRLISIGNSRGIRLPKALLQECGFDKITDAEVIAKNHQLIVKGAEQPRTKWRAAFEKIAMPDNDTLPAPEIKNVWDEKDWEWG